MYPFKIVILRPLIRNLPNPMGIKIMLIFFKKFLLVNYPAGFEGHRREFMP